MLGKKFGCLPQDGVALVSGKRILTPFQRSLDGFVKLRASDPTNGAGERVVPRIIDFELVVGVDGSARDVGGEIQRLDGVIITDSNLTNQSSTRPRCRRKRRCQSCEDRLRRCVYIPH